MIGRWAPQHRAPLTPGSRPCVRGSARPAVRRSSSAPTPSARMSTSPERVRPLPEPDSTASGYGPRTTGPQLMPDRMRRDGGDCRRAGVPVCEVEYLTAWGTAADREVPSNTRNAQFSRWPALSASGSQCRAVGSAAARRHRGGLRWPLRSGRRADRCAGIHAVQRRPHVARGLEILRDATGPTAA